MIDPTSLIVGAGLFVTGLLTGRLTRPHRKATVDTPKPLCGCEHGLEYHDPETKKCHGQDSQSFYTEEGVYIGTRGVPCTCRRYVGPEPLTELYAPPVIPHWDTPQ